MSEQEIPFSFDASQVEPQKPLEAVPANWYAAFIEEAKTQPTAKEGGLMIAYTGQISEGPYKGRRFFDKFNVRNANPQAQEIGQQQLSGLCHAINVIRFQTCAELINKPFAVKLGIEGDRTVDELNRDKNPATGSGYKPGDAGTKTYEARNTVKGFKPYEANLPGSRVVATTGAAAGGLPGGAPAPAWAVNPGTPPPTGGETIMPPAPGSVTPPPGVPKNFFPPAPNTPPMPPAALPPPPPPPAPVAPPPPPPPPRLARKFFVGIAAGNVPLRTEDEVLAMIQRGEVPPTVALVLETEAASGVWKNAQAYNLQPSGPAATGTPSVLTDPPPWGR